MVLLVYVPAKKITEALLNFAQAKGLHLILMTPDLLIASAILTVYILVLRETTAVMSLLPRHVPLIPWEPNSSVTFSLRNGGH